MIIKRVKSSFAAEVRGIDLRKKLPQEKIDQLKDVISKHGVVIIRQQALSQREFVRFSKVFGEAEIFPAHPSMKKNPEIFPVSNFPEGGHIYEGRTWHTDSIDDEYSAPLTLFMAHLLPSKGGDTLFLSTTELYQSLSTRLKNKIDRLEVVYRSGSIHPMVKTHPITKEKCLFLHFGLAFGVKGMDLAKGKRLINLLQKKYINSKNVYRHHYKEGDIVIWDNTKTSHIAGGTPPQFKRIMYRITISGDQS